MPHLKDQLNDFQLFNGMPLSAFKELNSNAEATIYILRTFPCASNPLLRQFNMVLKNGLEKILNVQLSDTQWKQASLPVHMDGLGDRSANILAPSAAFSCSHAPPPRSHPGSLSHRSRRLRSIQHQNHVKLSGQHDRTLRPVQAHQTSLGRPSHNSRL